MRDHRKLRAFELADALVLETYSVTREFPREEQFGLTSQLRRAAVSIPSNIVEGCARSTQKEYVHFLNVAYGSSCELEYQFSIAHRLGYLSEKTYLSVQAHCQDTVKVLNGLVRALRNK